MEEKEISLEETQKKISYHWKKFFKEQFFLIVVGFVSFITYLIIYFIKSDKVYLYLSFTIPCIILLWVGISAVYMVLKEKNKHKYNHTRSTE